ncbi:hypothetical protein EBZ39_00145 [bacterium]|nr:hypothetical protein [bacterium]
MTVVNQAVINRADVDTTWTAIQGRIQRRPTFQVVSEDAIATIENVIMRNHDEAYDMWPSFSLDHKKCRVHFWKERVLNAVPDDKRGIFAVYYHEYIASIERSQDAAFDEDEELMVIPNYGGHARAVHDAWIACTASLN